MTDPTFTEDQRVYHLGRKQYGTYVKQDWHSDESIVDFPDDDNFPGGGDRCRVTTAQLVAADEIEETG